MNLGIYTPFLKPGIEEKIQILCPHSKISDSQKWIEFITTKRTSDSQKGKAYNL